MPNIHRIRSFRLSDPFSSDLVPLLLLNISKFTRLETLILDRIELIYLENLLHDLTSLPYLCSLTIIHDSFHSDKNILYHLIFQLPVLKYCKLLFNGGFGSDLLPTFNNEYSPIEHLFMKGGCKLEQLAAILSYIPQLRRLSIDYPYADSKDQTELFPIVLNHLTQASLRLDCIRFDQLVPLARKLFQNLQVLHISTSYGDEYLDANQWEQLILSHMPHLRVFDIQYTDFVLNNNNYTTTCQTLMNGFTSPFWLERKWFFAHRHDWGIYSNRAIFYSTRPYRWKKEKFFQMQNIYFILILQEKTLYAKRKI
jgi:hypothetical protein